MSDYISAYICVHCGGYLSMPGKFDCDAPGHPKPTLAQRIALAIENDLNNRRGFHMSTLDNETNKQIMDAWEGLIEDELNKSEGTVL